MQAICEMQDEKFEPLVVVKWYAFLMRSESPTPLGQTNEIALKALCMDKDPLDSLKRVTTTVAKFNSKSQSNGALVRAAPMALLCHNIWIGESFR